MGFQDQKFDKTVLTTMNIPSRIQLFLLLALVFWVVGLVVAIIYPEGSAIFALNSSHIKAMDLYFVLTNKWPEPISILIIAGLYGIFKPYRVLVLLFNVAAIMPVTFAIKSLLDKSRPIQELGSNLAVILSRDISFFASDSMSFPSGHATSAFALAVFCVYEPKCKHWGIVFGIFILASSAAISRVYLGHHYSIDVVIGSMLGAFLSLIITGYSESKLPSNVKGWRWWNKN